MRGKLLVLAFLIFLFLFGYFYLPSESMDNLYQRIPEQVRENSQLVAAYYYSQTGFNGFREYQFALYNPENNTITIYTFKVYKFLKIWPRMKRSKIACKTPFNYSILATSPEELKDFKNCNNCRELLYKGKVYRNEELINIQPKLSEVLKLGERYQQVLVVGSNELSMGNIIGDMGDVGESFGLSGYSGLLILPAGNNASRGVTMLIQQLNSTHETVRAIFPLNITFTLVRKHYESPNFPLWSPKNLSDVVNRLESFRIEPSPWRWETSISGKHAGTVWFTQSGTYYEYQVYPKIDWIYKGDLSPRALRVKCGMGGFSQYSYYYP